MDGHRDVYQVIEQFRVHLETQHSLLAALPELAGKRLLCHCVRGAPCHGDTLITAVAEHVLKAKEVPVTIHIGVYHKMEEFTHLALGLDHPFEAHALTETIEQGLRYRMQTSVDIIA